MAARSPSPAAARRMAEGGAVGRDDDGARGVTTRLDRAADGLEDAIDVRGEGDRGEWVAAALAQARVGLAAALLMIYFPGLRGLS